MPGVHTAYACVSEKSRPDIAAPSPTARLIYLNHDHHHVAMILLDLPVELLKKIVHCLVWQPERSIVSRTCHRLRLIALPYLDALLYNKTSQVASLYSFLLADPAVRPKYLRRAVIARPDTLNIGRRHEEEPAWEMLCRILELATNITKVSVHTSLHFIGDHESHIIDAILSLPNLTTLDLQYYSRRTEQSFSFLSRLPAAGLQRLTLVVEADYRDGLTTTMLSAMAHLTRLHTLTLAYHQPIDERMNLQSCRIPSVRTLTLASPDNQILPLSLIFILFPHLETLHLQSVHILAPTSSAIPSPPRRRLTLLDLANCTWEKASNTEWHGLQVGQVEVQVVEFMNRSNYNCVEMLAQIEHIMYDGFPLGLSLATHTLAGVFWDSVAASARNVRWLEVCFRDPAAVAAEEIVSAFRCVLSNSACSSMYVPRKHWFATAAYPLYGCSTFTSLSRGHVPRSSSGSSLTYLKAKWKIAYFVSHKRFLDTSPPSDTCPFSLGRTRCSSLNS